MKARRRDYLFILSILQRRLGLFLAHDRLAIILIPLHLLLHLRIAQRQLVAVDQQGQTLADDDSQLGVGLVGHRAEDACAVGWDGRGAVVRADAEGGEQAPQVQHVGVEAALGDGAGGALLGNVARLGDG